MADTQHLQVTQIVDVQHTPYRRGHRHKRSFAISGEFEFLKQMESSTVPPLPCASPEKAPMVSPASLQPPEPEYASYSGTAPAAQSLQSPKFFVSEEPKFSSPFKGVPDAIINLDDALKTKPRSFKSHRRAESAPADLEVFMSMRDPSSGSQMIEEEEDGDEMQSDLEPGDAHLMSPLRPASPSPRPQNFQNASPARLREPKSAGAAVNVQSHNSGNANNNSGGNRNFNNSLKINRQKQRYYHYTKQLPLNAASSVQSQSLKGQTSSGSLSSAYMQTPASAAHTPSKQISTPLTPVSNSNMHYKGEMDRATSPTLRHNKLHYHHTPRAKNNNLPSTFNYESKLYDMPHSITVTKLPSSESKISTQGLNFSQEERYQESHLPLPSSSSSVSSASSSHENDNYNSIPESLLFGEPGDVEDPTSSLNHDLASGDIPPNTNSTYDDNLQEPRTFSDGFCIAEGAQKGERKKKSRLSSLMSIFSKSPHH